MQRTQTACLHITARQAAANMGREIACMYDCKKLHVSQSDRQLSACEHAPLNAG